MLLLLLLLLVPLLVPLALALLVLVLVLLLLTTQATTAGQHVEYEPDSARPHRRSVPNGEVVRAALC